MSRRPGHGFGGLAATPGGLPPASTSSGSLAPGVVPGTAHVHRLANGLTVCLLANPTAAVVTTALWYRVGTRDESPAEAGAAHFLEHMMFKGSAHYGPGDVDRRTQALGGANNAFTNHDSTVYHFNFAPLHWHEALSIEADRMAGLLLDPDEVESERRVILEEIAMYDAEPWDSLDQRVAAVRYPNHAYGRPVLGTPESLAGLGPEELAAFHRRYYAPGNAVLVVAGQVGPEDLRRIEDHFGGLEARGVPAVPSSHPGAGEPLPGKDLPGGEASRRVEQRKGEVARLLVSWPAPAVDDPDHTRLRVASTALGGGRASRLHRRLVDDGELCLWVQADLSDSLDPGSFSVAAELLPGIEPQEVEDAVLDEVSRLADEPPQGEELARVRQLQRADWVFGHERVYQQALAAGFGLALLDDLDYGSRQLAAALEVESDELVAVGRRYLAGTGESGEPVIGWSLPRGGSPTETPDELGAGDES